MHLIPCLKLESPNWMHLISMHLIVQYPEKNMEKLHSVWLALRDTTILFNCSLTHHDKNKTTESLLRFDSFVIRFSSFHIFSTPQKGGSKTQIHRLHRLHSLRIVSKVADYQSVFYFLKENTDTNMIEHRLEGYC